MNKFLQNLMGTVLYRPKTWSQYSAFIIKNSHSCYKKYIQSIEVEISSNLKYFWKFINDNKTQNGFQKIMFLKGKQQTLTSVLHNFSGNIFRVFTKDRLLIVVKRFIMAKQLIFRNVFFRNVCPGTSAIIA